MRLQLRSTSIALISVAVAVSSALAQGTKRPSVNAPAEPPAMAPKESPVEVKGAITQPQVFFVSPKDGETVSQEFTVKFGLQGMKIAPAGQLNPGTGHHHLIVDGGIVNKGEVVPADATHLHFGKGQTETKLKLAPGPHTLTLQFADGTHASYGPAMSQTIKIIVK